MNIVLSFILEFAAYLVIEVILLWTGELLLFALTLGRRKPALKPWNARSKDKFPSAFAPTALLGLAFWVAVMLILIS